MGENRRLVAIIMLREVQSSEAPGYKETSNGTKSTSALPPEADIPRPTLDFRF
jgi:hypothetical protein